MLVRGDKQHLERPVIGIMAIDPSDPIRLNFGQVDFLPSSYTKHFESSGARVVPVLLNQTLDYYETLFSYINGLVLPGGPVSPIDSFYANTSRWFYYRAIAAFEEENEYFPIWGECLGLEFLAVESNDQRLEMLTRCKGKHLPLPLMFKDGFKESIMSTQMPDDIKHTLETQNATAHTHLYCVTTDTFYNDSFTLKDNWDIFATSNDADGVEFISLMESKKYPILATHFHPEKISFEWAPEYKNTMNRSLQARLAAQFFGNFFVEETKYSTHQFPNRTTLEKHLIYNWKPEYTGKESINYFMEEVYTFDKKPFRG